MILSGDQRIGARVYSLDMAKPRPLHSSTAFKNGHRALCKFPFLSFHPSLCMVSMHIYLCGSFPFPASYDTDIKTPLFRV